MKLLLGDCLDKLKELEDNSVDAVVTDPPYGLSFMGKKWDYDVPSVEIWEECMRVLKPGGHLLSFAGSRTYHRMAVRIEDAGFEIRDQIMWVYGSGFPKSHDVGKNVEKIKVGGKANLTQVGTKPGLVATNHNDKAKTSNPSGFSYRTNQKGYSEVATDRTQVNGEIPVYEITNEWKGWGTALKPAHEPIVMARKPFKGNVAQNVLEWGTGGINVDGCRIKHNEPIKVMKAQEGGNKVFGQGGRYEETTELKEEGRWPANIIFECTCENIIEGDKGEIKHSSGSRDNVNLTHEWGYKDIQRTNYTDTGNIHTDPNCPCYILDQQSGNVKGFASQNCNNQTLYSGNSMHHSTTKRNGFKQGYNDNGGASRFFYCPKANKSDRNEGMPEQVPQFTGRPRREDGSVIYKETHPEEWAEAMSKKERKDKTALAGAEEKLQNLNKQPIGATYAGNQTTSKIGANPNKPTQARANIHPTVKPTDLMAYLIRLVTPKGGIVLDPFMGSGSTGKAAVREGMEFIGIEREAEYMEIAKQRIGYELDKKQLEESKRKFW